MQTLATYTPDSLIAGDYPLKTNVATLAMGQNCNRGAVLGKISRALGTPTAGANTGGGDISDVSLGKNAKIGDYLVECVETASGGGRFKVINPDGDRLDDAIVGTPYTSAQINFTLNDGDPDFAAGDSFTIPVTVGNDHHQLVDSTAVDGSAEPDVILAADTDATAEATSAPIYESGEFNEYALTFGGSDTADDHRENLRLKNIYLRPMELAAG